MNGVSKVEQELHLDAAEIFMPKEVAAILSSIKGEVQSRAVAGDQSGKFCYEDMATFRKAGLFAMGVPKELGGWDLIWRSVTM